MFSGWHRVENWAASGGSEPFFADSMVSTLVGETGLPDGFAVITRDATEARRREETLRAEADTDPLTKLVNRRGFTSRADRLIKACEANGVSAVILMFDIDHFKSVNDRFGHDGGDIVLRAVADALFSGMRKLDVLGRLGGEEFAALLAGASLEAGLRAAEGLREAVAALTIAVAPDEICPVTISIGATLLVGSLTDALSRADPALFAAKEQGRNRVVANPPTALT